jgi:dipeptidase E
LAALVKKPGRTLVIANAVDAYADDERRRAGVEREIAQLGALGLPATELDLRDYLDDPTPLPGLLDSCDLLWVRGGNTFVLLYLFRRTGLDRLVLDALARDSVVYGGYSAGVLVLQHTLTGAELVDDPDAVRRLYAAEPVWDGLGLIEYAVVPHYESPGHPETEACGRLAEHYRATGVAHRTLRDGQAIVIDGTSTEIA